MAERQIHNMDIITHACAVNRFIIISENMKLIKLTDCNLRNIRHEIVRNSFRILADKSALVSTDRIEVTQKRHAPVLIGRVKVGKNMLDKELCSAVGVNGAERHSLHKRHFGCNTVNRGRGRKYDLLNAELVHGFKQNQGVYKVIIVIHDRLTH